MKILICTLISTFVIFFNSVQSVTQPRRPKQPQLRNVLKYDGTICMWLFRGEIYGRHCGGSIHRISGGLECSRIPYSRQRRRQVKLSMQPTSVLKNVKILPPDPQKGDILYRHREPFGRVERVGQEMKILELHPAYAGAGEPMVVKPQHGDTLVLSGPWIRNPSYGHPEHRDSIQDSPCVYCGCIL